MKGETTLEFDDWKKEFDNARKNGTFANETESPPLPERSPPSIPMFSIGSSSSSRSPGTKRATRRSTRRKSDSSYPAVVADGLKDILNSVNNTQIQDDDVEMGEPVFFNPGPVNKGAGKCPAGHDKIGHKMSKRRGRASKTRSFEPKRPPVPPPKAPINSPSNSALFSMKDLGKLFNDEKKEIKPENSPILNMQDLEKLFHAKSEDHTSSDHCSTDKKRENTQNSSVNTGSQDKPFRLGDLKLNKKKSPNRQKRNRLRTSCKKVTANKLSAKDAELHKRAFELSNQGEYEDALNLINELRKNQDTTANLLSAHAVCSLRLGCYAEVIKDFKKIKSLKDANLSDLFTINHCASEAALRIGKYGLCNMYCECATETLSSLDSFVHRINKETEFAKLQKLFEEKNQAVMLLSKLKEEIARLNVESIQKLSMQLRCISPESPRAEVFSLLIAYVANQECKAAPIDTSEFNQEEAELRAKNLLELAKKHCEGGAFDFENLARIHVCECAVNIARLVHKAGLMNIATKFLQALNTAIANYFKDDASIFCSIQAEVERFEMLQNMKIKANDSFRNEKWQEAIDLYTSAMKLDKGHRFYNSIMLCNRAAAYMACGNYRRAIDDCSHALRLRGRYVKARIRRARCRVAVGKLASAIEDYKRAYEMEKDDAILCEMRDVETQYAQSSSGSKKKTSNKGTPKFSKDDRFSYSKYYEKYKQRTKENESSNYHGAGENYYRYSNYSYYNGHSQRTPFSEGRKAASQNTSFKENKIDPYSILGVLPSDGYSTIRKAYLRECLKYHPDKNPSGEDRYKEIQQAFDILKDKRSKDEYDFKQRLRKQSPFHFGFGFGFNYNI